MDADEQLGQPILSNGLPLTKIHHVARPPATPCKEKKNAYSKSKQCSTNQLLQNILSDLLAITANNTRSGLRELVCCAKFCTAETRYPAKSLGTLPGSRRVLASGPRFAAFSQFLSHVNARQPTGFNAARGQQRLAQTGGPSRVEVDRIENAGVESRDSCRGARSRHGSLSGPRRAGERRRHPAGPLRCAAQHDEESSDSRAKRSFYAAGAGRSSELRHSVDGPVGG